MLGCGEEDSKSDTATAQRTACVPISCHPRNDAGYTYGDLWMSAWRDMYCDGDGAGISPSQMVSFGGEVCAQGRATRGTTGQNVGANLPGPCARC